MAVAVVMATVAVVMATVAVVMATAAVEMATVAVVGVGTVFDAHTSSPRLVFQLA